MPSVLLDTTSYIDLQRAKKHRREPWAVNTIKRAATHRATHGKPGISPLGIMEITLGFEENLKEANLRTFLDDILPMFEVVGFGVPEACLAGEIYAKLEGNRQRIGVADTGIAATAIVHGLTVVTSNVKHFQRVASLGYRLNLENWRDAPP